MKVFLQLLNGTKELQKKVLGELKTFVEENAPSTSSSGGSGGTVVEKTGSTSSTDQLIVPLNNIDSDLFDAVVDEYIDDSNRSTLGFLCRRLSDDSIVTGARGFIGAGSGLDNTPTFSISGNNLLVDFDGLNGSSKTLRVVITEIN